MKRNPDGTVTATDEERAAIRSSVDHVMRNLPDWGRRFLNGEDPAAIDPFFEFALKAAEGATPEELSALAAAQVERSRRTPP